MKRHWLKWVTGVALLLLLGFGVRKILLPKSTTQKLSTAPPLAEFEMPPAHAPKTPFRLQWQQIDLAGAVISPDWKFLAKEHGGVATLISTSSGRVVKQVKGLPFPRKSLEPSLAIADLHPSIRAEHSPSSRIEVFSRQADLVAMRDFKSHVYRLSDGRQLWSIDIPHYGPQVFLGFSPNGKWVLTRETDKDGYSGKHFLRDARTGTVLKRFDWPSNPYQKPWGFSPDNRFFGVFDRGVKFYSMPAGKLAFRYDGFTYGPGNIEFSRGAQSVVTSDPGDESVSIWIPSKGLTTRSWPARYNAAGALAMSPDGKFLAAGSDGSCGRDLVRVWDFATAKELWVIPSGYNSDGVRDLAWSPDGTLIATASGGGPPQIWNARTGQRVAVLGGALLGKGTQASYMPYSSERSKHPSEPVLFWSSDARELWVGGHSGIRIWSRDGDFLREINVVGKIVSMSRCPSGQRVAIATSEGEIVLLHVKDETITWRRRLEQKYLSVAFLPSDRVISWGVLGNKIEVWDAKGGFTTQTIAAPLGTYKVDVSRDGKHLAAVGKDGIMLWASEPETMVQ